MASFTKKSEKNVAFAKGGNTKMFGQQVAGKQKAAVTEHAVSGGDAKFAKGGGTKMHSFRGSYPAKAGMTSC